MKLFIASFAFAVIGFSSQAHATAVTSAQPVRLRGSISEYNPTSHQQVKFCDFDTTFTPKADGSGENVLKDFCKAVVDGHSYEVDLAPDISRSNVQRTSGAGIGIWTDGDVAIQDISTEQSISAATAHLRIDQPLPKSQDGSRLNIDMTFEY